MIAALLRVSDKMRLLARRCPLLPFLARSRAVLPGVFAGFGAGDGAADAVDCVGQMLLLAEQTEEYSLLLGGMESKLSSEAMGGRGAA